jgi:hypothetical protein
LYSPDIFALPFVKKEETSKDSVIIAPLGKSINRKTINMGITSNHIQQSTWMVYSTLTKLSAERSQCIEQMELGGHYMMSRLNLN